VPDAGRNRRHAIVRGLDIPRPFDLAVFAAGLEARRGRAIRLRPFSPGPGVPCGLWIAAADTDYVYYEQATTPFHVTVIVLHEIAHMLLGHRGTAAWQNLAAQVMPGLDPSLVQVILGRSAYAMPEERDAETLASLILEQATALPVTAASRPARGAGGQTVPG